MGAQAGPGHAPTRLQGRCRQKKSLGATTKTTGDHRVRSPPCGGRWWGCGGGSSARPPLSLYSVDGHRRSFWVPRVPVAPFPGAVLVGARRIRLNGRLGPMREGGLGTSPYLGGRLDGARESRDRIEPLPGGQGGGFATVAHPQLAQDVGDVIVDGAGLTNRCAAISGSVRCWQRSPKLPARGR